MGCACVYYGEDSVEAYRALRGCKILVLPPLNNPRVARDASGAEAVLGYISLLTIGGWEPWARMVTDDIVVGVRREWGEKVVDVCSGKWRSILEYAAEYVLSRGFDGFFLDNLDLVDEYNWMAGCAASLITFLKRDYRNAIIMVNRGFTILGSIAPYIDQLLVESFPSYYERGAYRVWSNGDLRWIVDRVRWAESLARRYGFGVHALAYGEPGDRKLASTICKIVERYTPGVDVYMAPWLLKKPGRCLECGGATSTTVGAGGTSSRVGGEVSISVSLGPLGIGFAGLTALLALLLALRARRRRG